MQEEKYNDTKQNTDELQEKSFTSALVCYALIAAFILLTAGAGIFTLAVTDRSFSESENRVLSQKPAFTLSGLLDGSFMSDFESWLSDQFPLRDEAISLKTDFERLGGKREENGVYIGENNRLFERPADYSADNIKTKAEAINGFISAYPEVNALVTIVPNSSFIYSEELPDFLTLSNQEKQIKEFYSALNSKNLKTVDTLPVLYAMKAKGTDLYYRTDHHWTTRGAFGVYSQIADIWKLSADTEYTFHTVTDSFEGTLFSKSGVHDTTDTIEICVPEGSVESYTVNYESLQLKSTTLFDESKLSTKNKYEVFLGGNYDKVSIETTAPNQNTLLIVKDSYVNCMIPMLTPHFSRIVVVDPRYMTDTIETVMGEYTFTHVLFLYNLNTFNEDSAFCDVL